MKTKKMILITCVLTISSILSAQDFQKFGIGVGYSTSSIVGDSVSPFEISLRYRSDKHTFKLYAPLYYGKDHQNRADKKPDFMRQEHFDVFSHSWTKKLWGVGIGYDYTLYSYSALDFFAGIGIDYQAYEYREDFYNINYELITGVFNRSPVYEDFYQVEILYYDWNRVRGLNFVPNTGLRFTTPKFSIEAVLGLQCSYLYKKAYSFDHRKALYWETIWSSYYPDQNRRGLLLSPKVSIHFSYYF